MTSGISKALRNIVAERDSYTCVLCENGYTDVHHVLPRSQGGRNTPYNLVSLCRKCHMTLHREIPEPFDGWHEEVEYLFAEYLGNYYANDNGFYAESSRMFNWNAQIPTDKLDNNGMPIPRVVTASFKTADCAAEAFDRVLLVEDLNGYMYVAEYEDCKFLAYYENGAYSVDDRFALPPRR